MSIDKIERKSGTVYRSRVYNKHTKKIVTKSFKSFDDARDHERKEYGKPQTISDILASVIGTKKLGDFIEDWAKEAKSGTQTTRTHLRQNLGELDRKFLDSITPEMIIHWRASLSARPWADGKPLAESSIETLSKTLSAAFVVAVDRGYLKISPMAKIRKKRALSHQVMAFELLTSEEVSTYIKAFSEPLSSMVLMAAMTGLRIGELGGVRVRHVDLDAKEIYVHEQSTGGRVHSWGPLKSDKSRRVVPMPDVLVERLRIHLEATNPKKDAPLFTTLLGSQWNASHAGKALRDSCKENELELTTWHAFRHFYASQLIGNGVDINTVSKLLGHSSATITLEIYAHLLPNSAQRAADAMGSVLNL